MEKTWRWFGPEDRISLEMLRQIGVQGIVTSLHDVPNGAVWTDEAILAIKSQIEAIGLRWSVVESLPVSEQIKYAGPHRDELIENYRKSLSALGRCGINTVCYNFMPVIDWVRTDLEYSLPDGTSALYFDHVKFAYFDIDIIRRSNAAADYSPQTLELVEQLRSKITEEQKQSLIDTIIVKTQGFISGNVPSEGESPVSCFKSLLSLYNGVTPDMLRSNLKYFLEAIMPVCHQYDINMCIHPDDPPMQVFGLPRIVGNAADLRSLLQTVDDQHNGLTFCAGSLSAGEGNDVEAMAREFASRTHFVHLRSCRLLPGGDFIEAPHVSGRVDLTELVRIFETCKPSLPMRVDHGMTMLGDEKRGYNPGYSFHGRMLAFGQVEGMMAAVKSERSHNANN